MRKSVDGGIIIIIKAMKKANTQMQNHDEVLYNFLLAEIGLWICNHLEQRRKHGQLDQLKDSLR